MNTITYRVHDETEDGGFITFTAVVEDGRACGPYETTRTYATGEWFDVTFYLNEFVRDLAARQQSLHISEHHG